MQAVIILLLILSLSGYFLLFFHLCAQAVAFAPFLIVSSHIVILYAFAMIGYLPMGTNFILTAGLCSLVVMLWRYRNRLIYNVKQLLTPPILLFVVSVVFFYFKLRDGHFVYWDEFTYWGPSVKELVVRNALPPLEANIHFKEYPPAAALFHYYTTHFFGFTEGHAYFSQAILLTAPIFVLLHGAKWCNWFRICGTLLFCALIVPTMDHSIQCMYIDHVVGVYFGILIVGLFLARDEGATKYLLLLPGLFVLPLLKAVGFYLSIVVLGVIIVEVLEMTSRHQYVIREKARRLNKNDIIVIFSVIALFLSPMAANLTWKHRVKTLKFVPVFANTFTKDDVIGAFSPSKATELQKETTKQFALALNLWPIGNSAPGILFNRKFDITVTANNLSIVFFIFFIAIFLLTKKEHRRPLMLMSIVLLVGYIGYTFGLLTLYQFSFGPKPHVGLPSFPRYMGIYFLGAFIAYFGWLTNDQLIGSKKMVRNSFFVVVLLLLTAIAPRMSIDFFLSPVKQLTDLRRELKVLAETIKSHVPDDKRTYIVTQGLKGYEYWVLIYELAPMLTNQWWYSFHEKPRRNSECAVTIQSLTEILKTFDYLFLYGDKKDFWRQFNLIRRGKTSTDASLFKIERNSEGMFFVEVETSQNKEN